VFREGPSQLEGGGRGKREVRLISDGGGEIKKVFLAEAVGSTYGNEQREKEEGKQPKKLRGDNW